jgi:orotidine-5'-phosphate decarboxylase
MSHSIADKIILALDVSDFDKAKRILDDLAGKLKIVKIGSATFYRWGDKIVQVLKERNFEIFADFKFHDIPNTVASAAESILPWGLKIFTVHLVGGKNMLKSVVDRVSESSKKLGVEKPLVTGISVLTSIDDETLRSEIKIPVSVRDLIGHLAGLAKESGLDAIVASGHEIDLIRSVVGSGLKIICPGIRGAKDIKADQKRTLSAGEAFKKGADYVVIGRPIYETPSPSEALKEIISEAEHESE